MTKPITINGGDGQVSIHYFDREFARKLAEAEAYKCGEDCNGETECCDCEIYQRFLDDTLTLEQLIEPCPER